MNLIHIIVGILATWGIVEWYSHEQIFNIRNWAIVKKTELMLENKSNKFIEMLICVFCISHWIALFVSILITFFHHDFILTFLYTVIFVRGANLLNDIFYKYSRTPGNRNYEKWKKELEKQ